MVAGLALKAGERLSVTFMRMPDRQRPVRRAVPFDPALSPIAIKGTPARDCEPGDKVDLVGCEAILPLSPSKPLRKRKMTPAELVKAKLRTARKVNRRKRIDRRIRTMAQSAEARRKAQREAERW